MLSNFDFNLAIHVTLFIMSIVFLFTYFCYLFTLLLLDFIVSIFTAEGDLVQSKRTF